MAGEAVPPPRGHRPSPYRADRMDLTDRADRADRAGTCVRAAVFAVVGSVLAVSGHYAVADGVTPWRPTALLVLAQFAVAWPAARRRFAPVATLGCTLGVQGLLHVSPALAAGPAGPGQLALGSRPHAMVAPSSASGWHQVSATMTAAHVLAALTVAWLLHRADATLAIAVRFARAVRGVAGSLGSRLSAGLTGIGPRPLPHLEPIEHLALVEAPRTRTLEHPLVRRGPPGHTAVPVRPSPGPRLRPARPHPQGASPVPAPTRPYGTPPRPGRCRRADHRPHIAHSRVRPRGGRVVTRSGPGRERHPRLHLRGRVRHLGFHPPACRPPGRHRTR